MSGPTPSTNGLDAGDGRETGIAAAQLLSRRSFIGIAGAGAVGAAAAATGLTHVFGLLAPEAVRPSLRDRVLVVIEMAGGNDGMSLAVPYAKGAYYGQRPHCAIPVTRVLRLDDRVGLHPELIRLHRRGVAVVQGVGVQSPDLSHFEMLRRLWCGNFDGRTLEPTGFLGRVCDQLNDQRDDVVGITLSSAPSPALISRRAGTASLDPAGAGLPVPDDADLQPLWRSALRAMAHPDRAESSELIAARHGWNSALRLGELVEHLGPATSPYPKDNDLAAQLQFAARLIAARMGVRVIHVPMGADFDTHDKHVPRAAANLRQLDSALDAFLTDLDSRHLSKTVLVMTTSEFGRRVSENGGPDDAGLDHGAASVMLMMGAARPGLYGEYPSLEHLDADGNLRATVHYEEYLATAAQAWFGIPSGDVLAGRPQPLTGIV